MTSYKTHSLCPWCGSDSCEPHLDTFDYFLTREPFSIVRCKQCGLLYTTPQPDSESIGNYYKSDNYLSHNDKKGGLIPFIYNRVKRVNIAYKYKTATTGIAGKRMLDFGCGVGDFISYAKEHGYTVEAADASEAARKAASEKLNQQVHTPQDIFNMPDNSFDIITLWHVLEHIDTLKEHVEMLNRLLAPNGRLVIALPNYRSFDAQYYGGQWAAYDLPRHLCHFNRDTIAAIFANTDLKITCIKPLKWDAYYISMMSEQYRKSSMSFIKGMLRGLKSNSKAKRSGEYSSMIYIFERK